ncbi:MAG TPA: hypothetical protein DIW44_13945 [Anaerolineaceae bacterium]|nr:hypothetical protein [Anaerolineaceae bacterium]
MKLIDQKISCNVLLNLDELPFLELASQRFMAEIVDNFKFSLQTHIQDSTSKIVALQFIGGLFIDESGKQLGIERLNIEPRKVSIIMTGTSENAKNMFNNLQELIKKLSNVSTSKFLNPIISSFETQIVSKLNFDSSDIFNPRITSFINSIVQSSPIANANAKLTLFGISGSIDFIPTDDKLIQKRITLSRKEFVFSIAPGYPISDNTYLSRAPLETKDHLSILRKLEQM